VTGICFTDYFSMGMQFRWYCIIVLLAVVVLLQVDLHFAAPETVGTFRYAVILTSDSYLDLSFQQDIKVM